MKRLLAIAATFFHLILGLTACSHEHTPSEWIVDKNATTTEDGAKHTVCTECGETLETATIPRLSCSVSSKVLTVNGDAIRGSFSYATEAFSFAADITVSDGATYAISTDIYGLNTFFTKTVPLEEGENVFYLHTLAPDETMHLYTVTLYRNHLYTVRFDTRGGTEIADQRVEEGKLATQKTTERAGYTFNQWDHDFSTPITKNTTVRASWKANTDTAYTVEHYLENADGTYPTSPTVVERLTATTDTNDVERMRDFPHFSYDPTRGTQENVYVLGDGSLVIHSYYKRNLYSVSISGSEYGAISNYSGYIHSEKYYKYGDSDSLTASAPSIGCEFLGWFSGETRLSTDATFSFTADKNVVAKFAPKSEMQNFLFTAGLYSCTITGIKDKTVTDIIVPSYVTRIEGGAFSGCAKLESLTVPTLENCLGYHFGIDDYGDAGDTYGWYDPVYPGVYCYLPTALESVTVLGGRLDFNAFIETKVKNITIGKDVEAIEICGSGAWDYFFGYSASFEGFTVHPENESFKAENGILFSKDGKTLLCFPAGKDDTSYTIPDCVTAIGKGAFARCQKLTSIHIANSVKTIGESAFYRCYFEHITIPDSVTEINKYAFRNCSKLTSIVIPDSVTTIGAGAFYSNNNLASIVIGSGVSYIREGAFQYCNKLAQVYYRGGFNDWIQIQITGNTSIGGNSYSNYNLTSAQRYYYVEDLPPAGGNYWHYDANGEIAVW